jgi:mono/diheme cytochrome c family protein
MTRAIRLCVPLGCALALGHSFTHANEALKISPDELRRAATDFYSRCAACHGVKGKGDGPIAGVLTVSPPDLTRIAERNGGVFPEERVFRMISGLDMPDAHGTREMPVWGDVFYGEVLENSESAEDTEDVRAQVTGRINRLIGYLKRLQTSR